ncbi:hypothetical protein C8R45DRAFT_1218790 [Mycena sanguinolenta]|nr:hypothetical protein C8R45DRAFT_1218790 [Mycena sanguinolenta]
MPTSVLVPTMGVSLVGVFVSAILYGVTSLQTFMYFQTYSHKDPRVLKSTVILLWLFETAHTVLACGFIFRLLILNFGDFAALEITAVSDEMTQGMLAVIVFIVQCFYAHRLWIFTRNIYLTVIVVAMILGHLAFEIVTLYVVIRFPNFTDFHDKVTPYFTAAMVLAAASDTIIAITMALYLQRNRYHDTFQRTNTLLNRLIKYIVSTGALTSMVDVIVLTTYLAMPNNLVYIGFLNIVNNFYANSMLAMLNAREFLRSTETGASDIVMNTTGSPHTTDRSRQDTSIIAFKHGTRQLETEYRTEVPKSVVV